MRINLAAWLEKMAPALFALSTAAAIALYALRRTGGSVFYLWIGLLVGLGCVAFVAWRRARPFWYGLADARVLLETTLGLDARLSAAAAGVTPWPPALTPLPAVLRRNSLTAPGWLLAALGLLAVSWWAPLPNGSKPVHSFAEKPPALLQTEAMLKELAKLDIADPVSQDQLAADLRELAAHTPEEQYSHSSLEAADALRNETMEALKTLARDYDSAASALAAFESRDAANMGNESAQTKEQLANALDGLRTGRLAGNHEIVSALSNAEKSPSSLTKEQQRELSDRLSKAGAQARGVAGAAGPGANIAAPDWSKPASRRRSSGRGGAGGVSDDDDGDTPLTMKSELADWQNGQLQGVSGEDRSRAALGDLLNVTNGGAPQVDPSALPAATSGGTVTSPGHGGEAVWIDHLTPAERTAMKQLFK